MLRFLTAGESHGPILTAILDGMPADVPLTAADVNTELARRQQGYGRGGRMAIEQDQVHFGGGVVAGKTTGAPIALLVENRDYRNWAHKEIAPMTVPRPGHADLTGAVKYGYRELRLSLERASARETTMRVAVGAVCKRLLAAFGIQVQGYVTSIGDVDADLPDLPDAASYQARFAAAEASDVRCPDPAATEQMHAAIRATIQAKDTLGGVIEVVALGVPPGLGSHVQWDRKLDGQLLAAIGSVHSVKGAEIGRAFDLARRRGTAVHDPIGRDADGNLTRQSNRAGGLEGGITTGEPIILRAALKPIATTLTPLASVDLASGEPRQIDYERSDFCQVPRGVPIIEAMVAFVLANALLEKIGGDSLGEMRPRFESLRRNHLADLPMDNHAWQFGYEYGLKE
ncbi:MAG: chorismate synthase [Chloroflexi bacterium CFX4]|nr:chorismate synthase [Chloroflexi bacterium CFX4]